MAKRLRGAGAAELAGPAWGGSLCLRHTDGDHNALGLSCRDVSWEAMPLAHQVDAADEVGGDDLAAEAQEDCRHAAHRHHLRRDEYDDSVYTMEPRRFVRR